MMGWNLLIALHAGGALLALVLGAVMLVHRKGDLDHRRLGRIWMVDMYWVVLSSFGISRLDPGHLSWIHGLSAWTFVSLTMAWRAARRGAVNQHRGWAIGTYGGLVGAFLGAVAVPQRLVPQLVVHHPVVAVLTGAGIGLLTVTVIEATRARTRIRISTMRIRPTPISSQPTCSTTDSLPKNPPTVLTVASTASQRGI